MKKQIKMKIETSQAKHDLALAIEDAKRVISNTAAEALKVSNLQNNNFLVQITRIETKLEQVIKDVGDLKNNTISRIDQLELNSISKTDHEKVINDIVDLKSKNNWLMGGIGVLTIFLVPLIFIVLSHLGEDSGNKAVIKQIQDDHLTFQADLNKLLSK